MQRRASLIFLAAFCAGGCQFSLSVIDGAVPAEAGADLRADLRLTDGGADAPGDLSVPELGPDGQPELGVDGSTDAPIADGPRPDGAPPQPDQAPSPDQTPAPDQATPDQAPAPDQAPSPDLASSPDSGTGPCAGVTPVSGQPALTATTIATTPWARLVDLAFAPGDPSRLFVLEQHNGHVRVVRNGVPQTPSVFDLSTRVSKGNEQGLLSLAFHPGYAQNRKLYLFFTNTSGAVQVIEVRMQAGNPEVVETASERTLLTVAEPQSNHNGGSLRFGPDGYLYISLGDGGSGGDPHGPIGNGQAKDTFLGKILRIDVDQTAGGKPYAVPASNPFVGDASFLPEIYHWGLRNPFRISFDRQTGALWIADVGQNAWEELDYVAPGQKGLNFGWRCREGLVAYNMSTANCNTSTFTDPVLVHPTTGTYCSMIMGYPYRGCRMPGYHGTVFYSDYCHSRPRRFTFSGGVVSGDQDIATISANPIAWTEDHRGELYFLRLNNTIYRLDPS